MQLQPLPTLKQKPTLRTAEAGVKHSKALDTHKAVSGTFDRVGGGLASLDGTDYDFNPDPGAVVVVDKFLSNGPDTGVKVQSAELRFDTETGEVDRFKMVKDDQNSVTFEHKRYDAMRSSNPTFESVKDGEAVSFDLNPSTGLVVQFEG